MLVRVLAADLRSRGFTLKEARAAARELAKAHGERMLVVATKGPSAAVGLVTRAKPDRRLPR